MEETINLEHLALDGPIAVPIAVLLAIGLLLLLAWALGRERSVIGTRNAVFFWLLRGAAIGVVMWMLLAPTSVRVQRSTIRQSVAIITDVSRSMRTVDPPGTADDLRWALSASDTATATGAVDRALAAAAIAQGHLHRAARALHEHRAESSVLDAVTAARDAIDRIRRNLDKVLDRSAGWSSRGDVGDAGSQTGSVARVRTMLDGPDFQSFGDLTRALERGRMPSQKGWRESLPDLEHHVAGIRRRLVELTRSVAAVEQHVLQQERPELFAKLSRASRLSRVAGLVDSLHENVFKSLREKADIRYSAFDESLTVLPNQELTTVALQRQTERDGGPDDQTGLKTNLSAVLEHVGRTRRQRPLSAVFVATDAIHNDLDSADPRELAAQLSDTPVYVLPIGNTGHVRDIILRSVLAPNIAMRNDDVVITASLQAYDCEGETCRVNLIQDGEVIDRQAVVFDSKAATQTVRFEQRMSDVGVHQYQVSITPLVGEFTDENNFDHFEVNVTRSKVKVLLADEVPRWEYRYLTQLFRRAPKIECDELLFRPRVIATGKRADSMGFPVTVDDWDQYDVVILGDMATEHFPVASQETLIEYLKDRGGTLVMIAGHEFMPHAYVGHPLEEVLPVTANDDAGAAIEDFAFYVTELGRDHDALMIAENAEATRLAWDFVNRNAPLHSLSRFRRPLPTARTLIGAVSRASIDEESASSQSAFLCWQPVRRGKIIYLSGGETYRLRFLRGDRLHYRLWGQMLRWAIASDLAAGSERIRVRTDKSRYQRNETVQVTVRLADQEVAVEVDAALRAIATRADGQRFAIPLVADDEVPGQYRGEFNRPEPGVYVLAPAGAIVESLLDDEQQKQAATASFTVRPDLPLELLDTRADLALAHQIADATGGQVLRPTAVEEVVGLTDLEPRITETVETQPLWVQWKFLWIVFACLQTEWIIRKWKGLS